MDDNIGEYRRKYKDEVLVTEGIDPRTGEPCKFFSAKHHPGGLAPIVYDDNGVDCYIYTNEIIEGLELVGENVQLGT